MRLVIRLSQRPIESIRSAGWSEWRRNRQKVPEEEQVRKEPDINWPEAQFNTTVAAALTSVVFLILHKGILNRVRLARRVKHEDALPDSALWIRLDNELGRIPYRPLEYRTIFPQ